MDMAVWRGYMEVIGTWPLCKELPAYYSKEEWLKTSQQKFLLGFIFILIDRVGFMNP